MNDTKQTSKAPAFSVIMPTYNRAFCIKTAIDSLLNQTYQQFELIIVDDGSTDRTEQLIQKNYQKYLKSGKFKYIKLNHVGVSAARNVGIKEAKNKWITYLDTDNYLLSNALGVYSYNISKNPEHENFYGKFISKTTKEVYGKLFKFDDIKKQNTIDLGVYLHTKQLVEKCGAFDETLKRFVDWEMIARHCAYSHPIMIDEIVMEYNDSTKIKRITTSEKYSDTYAKAYQKIKNLSKNTSENFQKVALTVQKDKKHESCFFKIIVPNYNNMPYIQKCLDSILNQTFQDFKIVVVDDLSTDKSDKFCEMYARKYPDKIVYMQLKKKGHAGAARNAGLAEKTACKYIWFIDSDDYVYSNDVLQNMHTQIVNDNYPDVLRCAAYFIKNKGHSTYINAFSNIIKIVKSIRCPPWFSCIKSCFSNITFVENRAKNNDVVWFAKLLDAIDPNKISEVQKPCVAYNTLSVTSCQSSKTRNSPERLQAQRMSRTDLENYKAKKSWTQLYKDITIKNIFEKFGITRFNKKENMTTAEKNINEVFFKIIIPNYNNEYYIKKCLDSILTQTFQDFYIVVVDDMSTDASPQIIQNFVLSYPEKITILYPGKKLYDGGCRNFGIDYDKISSKYTLTIDGDDYLYHNNALNDIHNTIVKNRNPDAVYFDGYMLKDDKFFPIPDRHRIDLSNVNGCSPANHWLCTTKSNLFAHYSNGFGCDLIHQYKVLDNIQTYVNIDTKIYVYRFNQNSITYAKKYSKRWIMRERHRISLYKNLVDLLGKIKNKNIQKNIENRIQIVKDRIKLENYTYRPIIIAMASYPGRFQGMLNAVQQLHGQCDKLFICLNDYDKIPEQLLKYDNVYPVLAGKMSYLKENGRLQWINQFQNSYYLTVDDDINYPADYVQDIIYNLEKYKCKCIVSYHGSIFLPNNNEKIFDYRKEIKEDMMEHRFGGGVAGMVPLEIGFTMPDMNMIKHWDGDASISVWATLHGIKKVCLKHSSGWLNDIVINGNNLSIGENALWLNVETRKKRNHIYQQLPHGWESLENTKKFMRHECQNI